MIKVELQKVSLLFNHFQVEFEKELDEEIKVQLAKIGFEL